MERGAWPGLQPGPAQGDDGSPKPGVGRQDAVVTVAVDAGCGDKPGEALEELEGREDDLGAAIGRMPGEWSYPDSVDR